MEQAKEADKSEEKPGACKENKTQDEPTEKQATNDEVRELLKTYTSEIEQGRLDYRKLFDLTKQKLVRERNIVL